MLGFAVVDRQPSSDDTAVWLITRVEDARANHTNAVVISHTDERYDYKIWALTADRAVVLTDGSSPPAAFNTTLAVEVFDRLISESLDYQKRIDDAVAAARSPGRDLVDPDFPRVIPELIPGDRDEPQFRALAAANYIASVWRFWLLTDEQRVRRTTNPKTGKPPGIMTAELGDPTLAVFPPGFAAMVKPEPVRPRPATQC